ncbi:hypothetical protein ACK3TF_005003 [Chlorella vulgaris]
MSFAEAAQASLVAAQAWGRALAATWQAFRAWFVLFFALCVLAPLRLAASRFLRTPVTAATAAAPRLRASDQQPAGPATAPAVQLDWTSASPASTAGHTPADSPEGPPPGDEDGLERAASSGLLQVGYDRLPSTPALPDMDSYLSEQLSELEQVPLLPSQPSSSTADLPAAGAEDTPVLVAGAAPEAAGAGAEPEPGTAMAMAAAADAEAQAQAAGAAVAAAEAATAAAEAAEAAAEQPGAGPEAVWQAGVAIAAARQAVAAAQAADELSLAASAAAGEAAAAAEEAEHAEHAERQADSLSQQGLSLSTAVPSAHHLHPLPPYAPAALAPAPAPGPTPALLATSSSQPPLSKPAATCTAPKDQGSGNPFAPAVGPALAVGPPTPPPPAARLAPAPAPAPAATRAGTSFAAELAAAAHELVEGGVGELMSGGA